MNEESERVGLKHNIQKTKIMAKIHFIANRRGKKMEALTDFIYLGSKITADSDCRHEIKRCFLLGRKSMTNLDSLSKAETLLCQRRSI